MHWSYIFFALTHRYSIVYDTSITNGERWSDFELQNHSQYLGLTGELSLIARLMGPTWGPSGADRTQVGPMLAPWMLLSGSGWLLEMFLRKPCHPLSSLLKSICIHLAFSINDLCVWHHQDTTKHLWSIEPWGADTDPVPQVVATDYHHSCRGTEKRVWVDMKEQYVMIVGGNNKSCCLILFCWKLWKDKL